MDRKLLPSAPTLRPSARMPVDVAPSILARWNPDIRAASDGGDSISIFDEIGENPWTGEGVTANRIAGALRGIGGKDVTVNINSPGGDVFEGLAIYNMLREYSGQVTVRVLGVAASAASVIAMAADNLQIARAGFLMIHNAWVMAVGNRNDLREVADTLQVFDGTMADIYAVRSGMSKSDITSLMDNETWINGETAVDQGFADSLLASDAVREQDAAPAARAERQLDIALSRAGMPRAERRKLVQDLRTSTPSAARQDGKPGAAESGNLDIAREIEARLALAEFARRYS